MNFSKENVKVALCRMPVLSKQSHYRKKMTRILLRWEDQLAFLNAAAWRRKAVKQHLICDFLMLVGEGRLAELKSLLLSLSTVIFPPCWFFSLQTAATTVTIWGRVDDQLELLVLAGQYWNEEANAVVGVSG
uniref:Uncharacterized protein n=1 Tax=Populus trichocarpa TaxID=3694 RepID=A0A2K2BX45_POPTR